MHLRLICCLLLVACSPEIPAPHGSPPAPAAVRAPWTTLLAGDFHKDWKPSAYGGQGDLEFDASGVIFERGEPLTGITFLGGPPVPPYELEVIAQRLGGTDFFCALTLPAGNGYGSVVLGGWGGGLCGFSSLDGRDASENETTTYRAFETGRSYSLTVQVRPDAIQAQLDGEPLFHANLEGRHVSIRPEVEWSKPLGVAAFTTRARIESIRLRSLPRTLGSAK